MPQAANRHNSVTGTLLALGSNEETAYGGAAVILARAIEVLEQSGVSVDARSRLYRTPAFPAGAGPDFANAALAISTNLPPEALLDRLHAIERAFGRVRRDRWGARTLDIDILAHGDEVRPDAAELRRWMEMPLDRQATTVPDRLLLPHPRLQDRGFVLVPLADIAPDWRHPLTGQSVAGMLAALPAAEKRDIVPIDWPDPGKAAAFPLSIPRQSPK